MEEEYKTDGLTIAVCVRCKKRTVYCPELKDTKTDLPIFKCDNCKTYCVLGNINNFGDDFLSLRKS